MARNTKSNKPIEMAKNTEGWFNGKAIVPFESLSDAHLQNALIKCERQELYYFNRSAYFSQLAEKLTNEAERRKVELRHHKSDYTFKTHLQGRIKDGK